MATLKFANTLAGGTAGSAITTANSGGASGDAFFAVGTNCTYSNTHAKSGSLAAKCVAGAGVASDLWFDDAAGVTTSYIRFYLWVDAYPSASTSLRLTTFSVYNDNGYTGRLWLQSTGKLAYAPGTAGTPVATTAVAVTKSAWVRVEVKQVVGSSVQIRLYNTTESTTPDSDVSAAAGLGSGGSSTGEWRFGVRNDGSGTFTAWVDDLAIAYDGWIGPSVTGPPAFSGAATFGLPLAPAFSGVAHVGKVGAATFDLPLAVAFSGQRQQAGTATASLALGLSFSGHPNYRGTATFILPLTPAFSGRNPTLVQSLDRTQDPLNVSTTFPLKYTLLVYETITGDLVQDLSDAYDTLSYNTPLDDTGKCSAKIKLTAPELKGVNLEPLTRPWKFSLLVAIRGQVQWFGPINPGRPYTGDRTIQLDASELWAIFGARPMWGNLATVGVNGEAPTDMTVTADDLASLAVKVVQYATSMKGGALPLRLPSAVEGTAHTRTYKGDQTTWASEALKQLSQAEGGPDIRFDGEFADGTPRKARWIMRVA